MTSKFQIQHFTDGHIDHSKETLIAFLELALVEDLYGNDGRIFYSAFGKDQHRVVPLNPETLHIKALVPVGI